MACTAEQKRHAQKIVRLLARHYPDATCSLSFSSPLELLVATILSAQCTDQRVNLVTKEMFRRYRMAGDYATADPERLEEDVKSTGFYRSKAKSIRQCCQQLVDAHGGCVPQDLEALVRLPGIGRKTANVILGTAFGIPSGIVVDTHVGRLSRRLGLTSQKDPVKVEKELVQRIPRKEWIAFSHRMIQLGRQFCVARRPKCQPCPLKDVCPKIGVEPS
ncbi:MAG: endonuclease III [Thermoguttaceae bacterium]